MDKILFSIYLHRDLHENGMTLDEYATGVMQGEHPVISRTELAYQFGATDESLASVKAWAQTKGFEIINMSKAASSINLSGTAEQINSAFGIVMEFVTTETRSYWTYSGEIVVPDSIKDFVCHIEGLDNSFQFTPKATINPNANQAIDPKYIYTPTPIDLAVAYNFPRCAGGNQKQGYGQAIGIVSLGGGWTQDNLNSSFSLVGLTPPTVYQVSVGGAPNNPSDTALSVEVMLDIFCSGAVSPSAKIVNYTAYNSFQGFINAVLACANDVTYFPKQLSISWGTADYNWSSSTRDQMESALASCVALGITVFVATGDYGIQAVANASNYSVDYPATSQYVVACGGTVVVLNDDQTRNSESSWSQPGSYATGGGVSSIYPVPSYQTGFTTTRAPSYQVATITGRGIPDIAGMAIGYAFYYGIYNAYGSGIQGTSAVAPLMAGLCARLNQLSPKNLGAVNAQWYANRTTAFYDITLGDNIAISPYGYFATLGWDACTGIGVPNGNAVLKLSKVGSTYPDDSYGFRPSKAAGGTAWPRTTTGVR